MSLLPVAEAQARLLALASPLAPESAPLGECLGRVLAADVLALRDQPWADLSAMDGYAIRFCDLPGSWQVTGESVAGGLPPAAILAGEAVRIFTGAALPEGADCVLIQEDAERDGHALTLTGDGPDRIGRYVRPRASDFGRDAILLTAGTLLKAPSLGLAALAGHDCLPVRRRPRVAVLSTGDELVAPGAPVPPGKLPSSNGVVLSAMLAGLPCDVIDLGIARDDMASLAAAIDQARSADLLVTTGGASVGEHDLVRAAFQAAGGSVDFWRIRMRPGKPLMAGTLGQTLFLGLPGNPVSAFVTATLFVLPLVRHLLGDADPLPRPIQAILGADLPATEMRAEYLRGRLDDGVVTPLADQDSAATRSLAAANALILREGNAPALATGEPVPVIPLP